MEMAFPRLNNVVKSWLISKFLPDFSNIKELKLLETKISNAEEESAIAAQAANSKYVVAANNRAPLLTAAYDYKRKSEANPLLQEAAVVPVSSTAEPTRRNSAFQKLLAKFQPRHKNSFN